jgi:hypothetical protein
MALINYKSNQIKLNIPNKVLPVSVSSIAGESYWDYANGPGDIWYSGSLSKQFYRWEVTFSVTPINHGSHLTRDDFVYNGLDIVVGDWIASATSGTCCKIISINSKTPNTVTCIVEDWLRYNTFKNPTGAGIFDGGAAVVFSLNENGLPMLDPIPNTVSADFYSTVMSRFQYLNPLLNYVLEQPNHNFEKGDVVAVTNDGYSVANTDTMAKMIGVVIEPGPGPNYFMVSPNNRFIDFDPSIPGEQGDYIYVDVDGDLTTNDTGKIAFLKVQNAIPTVLNGTVNDPSVPSGHIIKINGEPITFTGSGNIALSTIVSQINAKTSNHSVVASSFVTPTTIVSNSAGTAYGLTGGYAPFSAYINSGSGNTLVNFTTTGSQYTNVATPEDMAADINSANIANLTASATATVLTLTEQNGNAVNIFNGNADTNSNFFVGTGNISGLAASTSAATTSRLRLTRSDGGEVLIFESTEFFRVNTGVASGHNGLLPIAMNVEQGLRTGTVTVVPNIAGRDTLVARVGDQAYVLDAGNGEWGLYLYDGTSWVQLGNQDSSTVDAKTMTTTFTMPTVGFGNSTTNVLGNISPGRKIVSVSMEIDTAFSGYSGNILPHIEVGTISQPAQFVGSSANDLTDTTEFYVNPEYVYPASNSQDLQIRVRCNHYQSTSGNVTVKLTYV